MHIRSGFSYLPSETKKEKRNWFRRKSPLGREPKSRFGLYLGGSVALVLAGFLTAKSIGKAETRRNLELLCSKGTGLYYAGESKSHVFFETAPFQRKAKHVLEGVTSYLYQEPEGFRYSRLAFGKGPNGLTGGVFRTEGSTFSLTRGVDMRSVFRGNPSCVDNVNAKMTEARRAHAAREIVRRFGKQRHNI
jgi:hypothetical protein